MSSTPDSTTTQGEDLVAQDASAQQDAPAQQDASRQQPADAGEESDLVLEQEGSDTADPLTEAGSALDEPAVDAEAAVGEEQEVADDELAVDEESDGGTDVAGSSRDRTEDLVREGEIAADFLEALLDIADLAGDLEVDIEGNRAAVAIVDSEDGVAPRRLVGAGGSVLDALQELTRLAVQAETGERSRLMLDVAGYRSDRREDLVRTARSAIAEVKESGAKRELEPMTAFERKVVHDEVLAAGLRSESEGTEPARYVVIQPSA